MIPSFTPEDIAAAQKMADRWSLLAMTLFIVGLALALVGGWRGWTYAWCWFAVTAGLFGMYLILDWVIVIRIGKFRHGILNVVHGGYGEAPAIGILLSPLMSVPMAWIARLLGRGGAYLWLRRVSLFTKDSKAEN